MDAVKTGRLIVQARKEKELTQKDLAERLHVSTQAVSKWERGLNCPDIALLEPLAEALELTVTELLSGQRGEEPKEELVRDSLRVGETQLRPKIRRWRGLFALAAALLLTILACLVYTWMRDARVAPQTETVLESVELEEQIDALADLLGNQGDRHSFLHMYNVTLADDMDGLAIRAELWTPEGLEQSWDLMNMSGFRDVSGFSPQQLLAFQLSLGDDGSLRYRIRFDDTIVSGPGEIPAEIPYLANGMGWSFAGSRTVVDREYGAVLLELNLVGDPEDGIRSSVLDETRNPRLEEMREGTASFLLKLYWK